MILYAAPLVEEIKQACAERAALFQKQFGRPISLMVFLVGSHPPSVLYTKRKAQVAQELGLKSLVRRFAEDVSAEELCQAVQAANKDATVDGILIQRPLPAHIPEQEAVFWVDPAKDVDAFHPLLVGLLRLGRSRLIPCTPKGIIRLLDYYHIPIEGQLAVVIGRSQLVGKPISDLLLRRHASVIQCHSKTPFLAQLTRQADLLIVAMGVQHFITDDYVKKGATVIDVGIHSIESAAGELYVTGDVLVSGQLDAEIQRSPVPKGVGPMTIIMLIENVIEAAFSRAQ